MKNLACLLSILCVAGVVSAAVPRVSNVVLRQDGANRAVVTYQLAEAPGIVTFDILTNGVSIGANLLTNAVGDVNRLVQPSGDGVRTITWEPWHTWPDQKFAGGVSASVTVWPTNAPPDFLAVELTKSDCPVTYYASEAALPWGKIWQNKTYKGDVLLMRRIHAAHVLSFMGSPETEANRIAGRETRRMCTLTNDYYIGVYPVTYRHYHLLRDSTSAETRLSPATHTYNMLRYASNNFNNTALPVNFPKTSRFFVGGSSVLMSWRNRTGVPFDLPTSAQWEFACRAGSNTPIYQHPFCNGTMAQLGVIAGDNGEVGQHGGNYWNLYDMLGNSYEWCLDYFDDQITDEPVTDPLGPTAQAQLQRVVRGNHAQRIHWRSAFFSSAHYSDGGWYGFRLCVMLP